MAARAKRDTPVLPINTFFESITTLPAGTMPNLLDAAAAREAAVVAYLKRRAGESRDAYSTRMGQLLFEQPVQFGFGTVLEERIAWEGLTKIGLALAAYRADHQRYPERLAALSPGYLKEVPKDHFSGEPPVYRGNAEGFTLHSVGANLKDDGGKDKKEGGDDLVMKTP